MLIHAEELTVSFGRGRRSTDLFLNVGVSISPGELVGLVGPSGSGKTTLGDVLLGLHRPDRGRVLWNGEELYQDSKPVRKELRIKCQKIYQDPVASFHPGQILEQAFLDVIQYHRLARGNKACMDLMSNAVSAMGLSLEHLERYPHQLSGGEIQRLAMARVLLLEPGFIVADEPTSRLDISVQAHVIRLLAGLVEKGGLGIMLISHDLNLVNAVCHRVLMLTPEKGGSGPSRLEFRRQYT
jgi:peptide/nickel transport system ATP-binding protein